ncbi:N-acyl-D-amino-acid deacylase family protein [Candidatus Poriferisocius sp.]|uniref:N-acyl-D-amino-acid deacylase family protein n=1 Tax=Candidatus Poriferisocius sp. TaxID=3101276 RepID=UPI003B5BF39C
MLDKVIANGTVVDGTGADRFTGHIGIKDGKVAVVDRSGGPAPEAATTIDADGLVVTPGFVDCHTHYDGQVTWDEKLQPSSGHGVTTVVMGNCGVGFAPVRPGTEEWLIQLMEGVEDIPGAALSEGISWGWETFPEYLDVLDERRLSIDVATQVAHGAVRGYVMGERGARNEPATPADIEAMYAISREALEAGALGVSTSRTLGHRAIDGEPVPGTFAAEDELFGLGRALADAGAGVFELAPAGAAGLDLVAPPKEMDWMRRLSARFDVPVSFALLQVDGAPDLWREMMDESLRATDEGARVYPQIAGRPFGMLIGLQTNHAFAKRPNFVSRAHLPFDELVAELRTPAVRQAILAEDDLPPNPNVLFDQMPALVARMLHRLYVIGDPPDYEPTGDRTVAALAEARGVEPMEMLYDLCLEDDGHALMMLPMFNYFEENHDVIREQLLHPAGVSGLSDGGAHCGMICDASIPTFMLTHWTRDRSRGEQLPLEWVVKKQTHDTAALYGLGDRGTLEVGKRADVNVIDHQALTLRSPRVVHDLPAGGRRLDQEAVGYVATLVAGEVTRSHGSDTGARPGRLVRGAR